MPYLALEQKSRLNLNDCRGTSGEGKVDEKRTFDGFLSLANACEGSNFGITGCPITCLGAWGSGGAPVSTKIINDNILLKNIL